MNTKSSVVIFFPFLTITNKLSNRAKTKERMRNHVPEEEKGGATTDTW